MDNKTSFESVDYDKGIHKVIPYYDEINAQVVSLLKHSAPKNYRILDTGCGTGTLVKRLFEQLPPQSAVLCDPSPRMLGVAENKLSQYSEKITFRGIGSCELDYCEEFDVVTAIQSHHYLDKAGREQAVANCYRALKKGGILVVFENTAAYTEQGKHIMLERLEEYGIDAGRSVEEAKSHSLRYGVEFKPITPTEHLELLRKTGFCAAEMLWLAYLQAGYYAIK